MHVFAIEEPEISELIVMPELDFLVTSGYAAKALTN
jgi:hypothetical protein